MTIRILGLDPGLVRTGWGVIAIAGTRLTHVAHGVVAPPVALPLAERLRHLHDGIAEVIARELPAEAAIEESFFGSNAASALKLGHARAAAMLAPALAGLPVAEYAARVVKKALVGTGAADKVQVAFMVQRLLPGIRLNAGDAADALAIAITHAHQRGTGRASRD